MNVGIRFSPQIKKWLLEENSENNNLKSSKPFQNAFILGVPRKRRQLIFLVTKSEDQRNDLEKKNN